MACKVIARLVTQPSTHKCPLSYRGGGGVWEGEGEMQLQVCRSPPVTDNEYTLATNEINPLVPRVQEIKIRT